MFKQRVKKEELFKSVIAKLITTSYADEGKSGEDESAGKNSVNYEDLIAKARKEEKDKLYPEIERYKKLFENMTENNNNNLLTIGKLQEDLKKLREEKESAGDAQKIQDLEQKIQTLEQENEELKSGSQTAPNEEELRNSIREELEAEFNVKLYKTEKLASDEVKNSVLPMFIETIDGSTTEEIDASIARAIENTNKAKEQLGIDLTAGAPQKPNSNDGGTEPANNSESNSETGNNGGTNNGSRPPKASSTVITLGKTKYTAEDIQNLDPSSEEFKELRKQLGLK